MTVRQQLAGHRKDLGGGFEVSRLLPAASQRSVGPFVFFDHFGPALERVGVDHDVRPHPHIGLATVTYLFEGALMHRDSLGSEQLIAPGAINWMTAGRGIVHSERRPEQLRQREYINHGLQLWTALPREHEEDEPSFSHTPATAIPEVEHGGARVRVLVGEAFGEHSPVPAVSRTLYLDVDLSAGATLDLPLLEPELAVYPVRGDLTLAGQTIAQGRMAVLEPQALRLLSEGGAHFVLIGGEPLDGPRHMWWNFVSSRRERILQAGEDWSAQRMGRIPGEHEFIPLPPTPLKPSQPMS